MSYYDVTVKPGEHWYQFKDQERTIIAQSKDANGPFKVVSIRDEYVPGYLILCITKISENSKRH